MNEPEYDVFTCYVLHSYQPPLYSFESFFDLFFKHYPYVYDIFFDLVAHVTLVSIVCSITSSVALY
jgi:hypothetical protein